MKKIIKITDEEQANKVKWWIIVGAIAVITLFVIAGIDYYKNKQFKEFIEPCNHLEKGNQNFLCCYGCLVYNMSYDSYIAGPKESCKCVNDKSEIKELWASNKINSIENIEKFIENARNKK